MNARSVPQNSGQFGSSQAMTNLIMKLASKVHSSILHSTRRLHYVVHRRHFRPRDEGHLALDPGERAKAQCPCPLPGCFL